MVLTASFDTIGQENVIIFKYLYGFLDSERMFICGQFSESECLCEYNISWRVLNEY